MNEHLETGGQGDNKRTNLLENVTFTESSIAIHHFSDKIMDNDIHFQVTKLCDSFYLWVGKSATFGELSVAMTTRQKTTSSTILIGGNASPTDQLSQRLSKKTGKQVFVGGDLNAFDQLALPLLERRIAEEMTKHPEHF